jgi:hypothetical protein
MIARMKPFWLAKTASMVWVGKTLQQNAINVKCRGKMKILIGCEYSGKVREAFRKLGHDVTSCDLLPSDDNSPHHIIGDVVEVIQSQRWDLIIMHPPCTALAISGNRWYATGMPKYQERIESIKWTMDLYELAKKYSDRVCMENPVGVLPMKATQYIQPWQFGHGEQKKTGLWLHNLPNLMPTNLVEGRKQRIFGLPPTADRWKIRSETYQGIANAMAAQWSQDGAQSTNAAIDGSTCN